MLSAVVRLTLVLSCVFDMLSVVVMLVIMRSLASML